MIVYVNPPTSISYDGVEIGCVTTMANPLTVEEIRQCRRLLVDQGLGAAKRKVSDGEIQRFYAKSIKAAVVARAEVYAIVPDVFNDLFGTIELWHRWAPRIRAWGAVPILMLQQPWRIFDWVQTVAFQETSYVAIPSRWIGDIHCARFPEKCARIEGMAAIAAAEAKKRVHVAGGTLPVLRLLCHLFDTAIHSIDTMAYRLAVNNALKAKYGGRYMANKSTEGEYLREWIEALLKGCKKARRTAGIV